jgi:hypothetical protein
MEELMARMRRLLPARKVVVAALAAGAAGYELSGTAGLQDALVSGPASAGLTIGLIALLVGWLVPPAAEDGIETPPPRPVARQATGMFLAS